VVNAATSLYCIFGNPVRHSFSPAIQNAAFAQTGIDAVYVAFEVTDVPASVAAMRTLGIRGASVTIPHKVEAMKYVDEVEDIASMIGSVNTLVNKDGKIFGTNTDAYGFYRALSEKTSIDGKTVAVFGSGGGSRAVCFSLFHYAKPERLYIFVRDDDRWECERMRENLLRKLGLDEPQVISRRLADWDGYKDEIDILVNTTPLGMHPNTGISVIPGDSIPGARSRWI
jgi:shikimate dehydrogenase